MTINSGQAPITFNENYPVPGLKQSSQQFRDNFKILRVAIENLQNVSRDETGILDFQLYVSPDTGRITASTFYVDETKVTNPDRGTLSYQNNALYYWNGSGWAPVASGAASLPGPQGIPGPRGDGGPEGRQGPIGPRGEKGNQGDIGRDGYPGPAGPKGDGGPEGKKGEIGARGLRGFDGPRGPLGERGQKGDKGDQGVQGIQGIRGEHNIPSVLDYFDAATRDRFLAGDFAVDVTKGVQAALDAGKNLFFPAGKYRITSGLKVTHVGQYLYGCGAATVNGNATEAGIGTFFMIAYDYDVGFSVMTLAHSCGMFGFTWDFQQPDTAPNGGPLERNHLKVYPPALDVSDSQNVVLDNIEFRRSTIGLKARGNCGGLRIGMLRDGSLQTGFDLEYTNTQSERRSVIIDTWEHWHWGFADRPGLQAVHDDGITNAVSIGPCLGGVSFTNLLILRARLLHDTKTATGPTQIANLDLRGVKATIDLESGFMDIGTLASINLLNPAVTNSGGVLRVDNCNLNGRLNNLALIRQLGNAGATSISSGLMNIDGNTVGAEVLGGHLNLSNIHFQCGSNEGANRNVAMVRQLGQGGRLSMNDCYPDDRGSAVGAFPAFIQIERDDHHIIMGNRFLSWRFETPLLERFGIYGPNGSIANGIDDKGHFHGKVVRRYMGGTFNADGFAVLYPEVAGLDGKMTSVSCFASHPEGGLSPATIMRFDKDYIYLQGPKSIGFNCWIEYIE